MEDLEEFKASKEQGFNPTDRLLNLLINSSGGVTVAQVAELIKQNVRQRVAYADAPMLRCAPL